MRKRYKATPQPVLYRVHDEWERLIYIGITDNIQQRLAAHRASSWWSLLMDRVDIEDHPTMEAAAAAETIAIRDEQPAYNVMRLGQRHGFPVTDYEVQVSREWLSGFRRERVGCLPHCLHRVITSAMTPPFGMYRNLPRYQQELS